MLLLIAFVGILALLLIVTVSLAYLALQQGRMCPHCGGVTNPVVLRRLLKQTFQSFDRFLAIVETQTSHALELAFVGGTGADRKEQGRGGQENEPVYPPTTRDQVSRTSFFLSCNHDEDDHHDEPIL